MVGEETDFLGEEEKHCQSHREWKNKTSLFFVSQSFSLTHISTLPSSLFPLCFYLSTLHWKQHPHPTLLQLAAIAMKSMHRQHWTLGVWEHQWKLYWAESLPATPHSPPTPLQATPTTARRGEISAKDLDLLSCWLLLKAWKHRAPGLGGCGVRKELASSGCPE